jgi:enterochelin esterase-like enzyme
LSLTGWPFMALAITMVLTAPLATFLLWPHIKGPWAARAMARLGLIIACQLSAILVAGLLVNNKFQLYGSWNDLLGRDGGAGMIVQAGGVSGGKGDVAHGDVAVNQTFTRWGDTYQTTLAGPRSKLAGDVYVWLPPQYGEAAYQHYDFPVVELFQGTPGTVRGWFKTLGVATELEHLIASGASAPFVLVAPDINLLGGRHNADCSNIPNGPQVATWLTQDVRQMIIANFRVTAGRDGWGAMGYSEGGFCAAKLLVQYPQDYVAGVGLSADTFPSGDLLFKKNVSKAAQQKNNVLWLLQHQKPVNVSLLMAASAEDGATLKEAYALLHAARSPMTVEILEKLHGKHNAGVWESWFPGAFQFLTGHLVGPVAIGPSASTPQPTKSPTKLSTEPTTGRPQA